MMKRLFWLALSLAALALPAAAQDRPRIVAVNYALAYFADRLGGDAVDVEFPVPDGTDPSFWRPGIADIGAIQSADLIVLNGAGFATWTTRASLPRSRIVDTARGFEADWIRTETVTHSHGDGGEHSHTGTASYTWLDPDLARRQAQAIADAMVRRGLVAADSVAPRMAALARDLAALQEAGDALAPLAGGRTILATHPRYQYLARAHGLRIEALDWDAGAAPDAAQLDALRALADGTGAQVLLWEAAPPAAARADIAAMGLADVVFPPMASAPDDGDYLSRLDTALADLARALQAIDG